MVGLLFDTYLDSLMNIQRHMRCTLGLAILVSGILVWSCTPRIEVVPPDKPITINLNIKIDHEVRIKVEKDLEDVFSEDSKLF